MGVRRKSVLPVVALGGCLCLNFPLCSFGSECDSLGLLVSAVAIAMVRLFGPWASWFSCSRLVQDAASPGAAEGSGA